MLKKESRFVLIYLTILSTQTEQQLEKIWATLSFNKTSGPGSRKNPVKITLVEGGNMSLLVDGIQCCSQVGGK